MLIGSIIGIILSIIVLIFFYNEFGKLGLAEFILGAAIILASIFISILIQYNIEESTTESTEMIDTLENKKESDKIYNVNEDTISTENKADTKWLEFSF